MRSTQHSPPFRGPGISLVQNLPAGLTILFTAVVLLAHAVRVPALDRLLCRLGPMKINATICGLLAGTSLALLRRSVARGARAAWGEVLSVAVAYIGTVTVAEYLTARDWGFDNLFFRPLACDAGARMPPGTALAFTLFGVALVLRHRGRGQLTAEALVSGTAVLTSIRLLGFLYGASVVHTPGRFTAMSIGLAVTFVLLCAGFFISHPEQRRSAPLYSSSLESAALRRLLLAVFLWPTAGGWGLIEGVRIGLFDMAFGAAMLVTMGFVVFALLILYDARELAAVRRTQELALTRFRNLVEFSPDGILTVDRNGSIRVANGQMLTLTGYSRAELVGQPVEILLPGRFRGQHVADRTGYHERPRPRPMGEGRDLWARRKDGSEFPVEVSLSPVQGPEEPEVLAIMRDVTERREAERLRQESEDRYRSVVQNIDEVVYVVETTDDPLAGRTQFVSDRVESVTGYTAQEFQENPQLWQSRIHPDDIPSVKSATRQLFTTGVPVTRHYRLRHKRTRDYRSFEDRVVVQTEPDGRRVRLFGVARDVTDRVLAEEALKHSEERYREMFMDDLTGACVATPAGKLLACNPAFASMFGFASVAEALRSDLASLYEKPQDRQHFLDVLRAERRVPNREREYRRRDGTPLHVIENAVGVFDRSGELIEIRGYLIDTTQRKQLEDQLRQAQKMEAVGRLAGGIAHDFNNLLTAILGFSEMLLDGFAPGDRRRADAEEIRKAGTRAAALTRQLLAFSRRQVVHPVVLDVNTVVTGMAQLVRRVIGEDLDFATIPAAEPAHVKIDAGQLEQVVMNLGVNARDAMPKGGKLTIETSLVDLDEFSGRRPYAFRPGRYVLVSVSDTGTGIDAETLPHIFEPFFTTKEAGRGTGLGLATVYGIVKQAGGMIDVNSEPGHGTTFKVYLPWTADPLTGAEDASGAGSVDLRGRTILVVEDDAGIRELIRRTLVAAGCRILEAPQGSEALRLLEQHGQTVDLVLTDVVMPEMGGRPLADELGRTYPGVKILFMSGYPSAIVARHGMLDRGVSLLEKPFSPTTLKHKVMEALC